jgi:hypothetical protein
VRQERARTRDASHVSQRVFVRSHGSFVNFRCLKHPHLSIDVWQKWSNSGHKLNPRYLVIKPAINRYFLLTRNPGRQNHWLGPFFWLPQCAQRHPSCPYYFCPTKVIRSDSCLEWELLIAAPAPAIFFNASLSADLRPLLLRTIVASHAGL